MYPRKVIFYERDSFSCLALFYIIGKSFGLTYDIKTLRYGCAQARRGSLLQKQPRLAREFRERNSLFAKTLQGLIGKQYFF